MPILQSTPLSAAPGWSGREDHKHMIQIYDDGVQALCDRGVDQIPDRFVKPEHERPCSAPGGGRTPGDPRAFPEIPVIDLSKATHGDGGKATVIQELRQACQEWGIFQVINHGLPETCMIAMMEMARRFFELPVEKKMKYYHGNASAQTRYGISYNTDKDQTLDWRDFLFHPCHPLSDQVVSTWPDVPPSYRDTAKKYGVHIRALALRLLGMLSESLGLCENYLADALKDHEQKMLINHYPPCPQPSLTLGVSRHTDPNIITILQQDEVAGLQVLRDDAWIPVPPIRNAFVIHLGDQMKIISNGRYECAEHRAVVNSHKTRFSIATFYGPSPDAIISPAAELVDEDHPAQYRRVVYGEYLRAFWARGPNSRAYIRSVLIM